jgi:uncharacterized protein (TIGR02118 family)
MIVLIAKGKPSLIRFTVMYPNTPGSAFDMAYYCSRHFALLREKLGAALKGCGVDEGIAGGEPGSPAPYRAIGHLLFESVEAFQAAFGPHEQAIVSDIPNYTNIEPTVQISEVKM